MYQQITEAFLTLACLCHSKGRLFFPVLRAPLADVVSDFHEIGSSTKKEIWQGKRKWAYIVTHVTFQVFLRAVRASMTSEVFLQSSWCARSHPCPAMLTLKRTRPRVNKTKVLLSMSTGTDSTGTSTDGTGTGYDGTGTGNDGTGTGTGAGTESSIDGICICTDSTDRPCWHLHI